MNMRETIEARYKEAIKAKNNNEVNTLRLIKSAIKYCFDVNQMCHIKRENILRLHCHFKV